ncbi:BnaC04g22350D [Brassica napus]|uniref:RING-type E3 ubiquitin transferase n=1 Tax=Brassica napus TaxID=3708 RepID=A0A078HYA3_BRANA|nr:BnaC04g22350D [Brassica napus]
MMYAQTVFRFCECITVSILVVSFLRLFSKLAIFIVTRPWRRYRTFTFRSSQWIKAVNKHSSPLYCAVCLQEAEEGDKMRRLTICRHCFHADCIDPWLGEMSSTCPLCRAEVPPLPPVNPLLLLFYSKNPVRWHH